MEEIIVANLTLDTYQRNKVAPLVVPQGDYGARVIRAKITDLGKPVIVESTAAVSIVATRSGDGESQAFSGSVNADGTVTVPVTQWMLDVPEEDVTCHIVVTGIGYQYSTTSFLIDPQAKAAPTEIAPDDPRQDLVTEVLAGENTRRAAEAERVSNENARIAAENARQSAEEQRLTDESTRITNEAQRVSAEASRDATFKSWAQDIASLPTFDGRISAIRKRVENIESGIPAESFIIDDSVAYTKDVPENVALNAVVQKVGGMTRKCANLLNLPNGTYRENGLTITVNNQNISFSGVAYSATWVVIGSITLAPGEYTFTGAQGTKPGCDIYLYHASQHVRWGEGALTVTETKTFHVIIQVTTMTIDTSNFGTINLMLNEGSTALPYEPYFEGLRSAKVTEVESVGVNVLDIEGEEWGVDGWFITLDDGARIHSFNKNYFEFSSKNNHLNITSHDIAGVYPWLSRLIKLEPNCVYRRYRSATVPYMDIVGLNDIAIGTRGTSITVTNEVFNSGDYKYWMVSFYGVGSADVMISKGADEEAFSPYQRNPLPIPEAVRPANGINENVYDFIEWAEDGSVKKTVRCGVVDLRELYWEATAHNSWYSRALVGIAKSNVGLCDKYTVIPETAMEISADKTIQIRGDIMYIKDSSITDASQITGTLLYALANPTTEDISDLITADNLVPVQSGGTMTPVNEYSYAVPSTIIYQSL